MTIRSAIEGLDWPAVPDQRGGAVLSILFQFEQSQWWPAEKIAAQQFGQLRRLLDHARATVPFYRDRLDAAPKGGLGAAAWAKIPLLTRAEIQAAGSDLESRLLPQSHGRSGEIFTSGSTGKPIRALRSQASELYWSAFTIRDHLWHRRDFAGTLATIRESGRGKALYPRGKRAANWGRSSAAIFTTGPSVGLNLTTPLEQQVEWLVRQDPDYLLTHPSMVDRLARHCLDQGVVLPKLRQVETISELLRPATRELCQAAWGVPIKDLYSTRETGYIALQCPDHEHYHVQSEGMMVEVLNPAGAPCGPGETGRVVVTPLHNFAMPLIRYDIGDFAEVGPPCSCGRGLPVLTQIFGRRQNMLILPNGEAQWPLLSSGDIRGLCRIAPIGQYQIAQTALDQIELRVTMERDLTAAEKSRLRAWVQERFGALFAARIERRDSLPRSAAGKFEDFVNEIAAGKG